MIEVKNLENSYKFYRKNTTNPITGMLLYLRIVSGYMRYIMSKVFEGYDVDLGPGNSLGNIAVRGRKVKPYIGKDGEIKGVAPSWAKTKELWDSNPEAKAAKQLVYCFNEHSNGIKYRLIWHTPDMRIHNKCLYYLAFSRDNKRTLWKLINEGKEYVVNVEREIKYEVKVEEALIQN